VKRCVLTGVYARSVLVLIVDRWRVVIDGRGDVIDHSLQITTAQEFTVLQVFCLIISAAVDTVDIFASLTKSLAFLLGLLILTAPRGCPVSYL